MSPLNFQTAECRIVGSGVIVWFNTASEAHMSMQTDPTLNPKPTREDVLNLIASMNAAQLALWYEIGKSIQNAPVNATPSPTDEELAAEDALWNAAFISHANRFEALAAQAEADIEAGQSLPMFDDKGSWLVDDYAETIHTKEDFAKTVKDS